MSNSLTFKLSNIFYEIFRIDDKWLENRVYKISWKSLVNWLTRYRKANFLSGPSYTVGQPVGLELGYSMAMAMLYAFKID